MNDYKSLQPFRFWCQKVLPLVYDDSLSYYELLCKVVDYLNTTINTVNELGESFNKLQSYVNNYFTNLNVQTEINNKLDEMAINGTLESIISKYLNQPTNSLISQRIFRIRRKMSEVDFGQGCCFTGSSFLLCGSLNDTSQRIVEIDTNGNIIRSSIFTDTHMGHANAIAKRGNLIYIVNGVTGTDITVLNYNDLSINKYITQTLYDNVYGICEYNNIIYALCKKGNTAFICVLTDTDSLLEICAFEEPTVYTGFNLIPQGFCIIGYYAYIAYNYNNNIIKININSGTIYGTIDVGLGDGYFPFGELETPFNVNGQMYLLTKAYLSTEQRSIEFIQFFKTNVGGTCVSNGNYGGASVFARTLYVSSSSTSMNPDGIVNKFYDVEECCIVYTYLCNEKALGLNGIIVESGNYDLIETFFLCSVFGTFNLGNVNYNYIGIYDSSCTLLNAIFSSAYLQGNVTLHNCTCNGTCNLRDGVINVIGGSYNVLNCVRTNISLINRPNISNLTREGNNTFSYKPHYMVGNGNVSLSNSLTVNMNSVFWLALSNESIDKSIEIMVSGGNYGYRKISGRLTGGNIDTIKQGKTVNVDMQTMIMGESLFIATIRASISKDKIVFSMPSAVKYDGTSVSALSCTITDITIVN